MSIVEVGRIELCGPWCRIAVYVVWEGEVNKELSVGPCSRIAKRNGRNTLIR